MSGRKSGKSPAGKSKSAAAVAAREHTRLLREAQIKRERRRRLLLIVGSPVLIVILIVVAFLVVRANRAPAAATGSPSTPAGTALESSLANIPAATFNSVGTGTAVAAPTAVTGTALTANGKPRVLYVGAEFCPYCAGERWAVVAALSRFGTFSNLGLTASAAGDVFPNTATLSFHGATYTSPVLSFTGVETTTNIPNSNGVGYTPLDTLTAADTAIDAKYNTKGSIPFVDFGNKWVITGASYDVSTLQGLNQTQIAAALQDPNSAIAKGALGAANMMTAALCNMTNDQPAAVCTSAAVTSQKLPT